MRVIEVIEASGHPKIRASHTTTLEITKDADLTERGDCIVATSASKGAADLSPEFSKQVKNDAARVALTIKVANLSETITGRGDRRLFLSHPTDLVVRKSGYVCPRTLMVRADRSASDLSREFARLLRDRSSRIVVEIVAEL
jgi:hypothetical protein